FALRADGTPKGTKPSEVGEIPEDWEVVTLGDIGQTVIGLTYSPNDVADFGTLVLRSSNVQNGKLAYADNVYVNMELPERVIVKQGDILICVRNGSRQLIGKCALIDENAEGSAFGAFMSIFRTKYSVFVFYQFQSDLIQNQINEIMGATINQITNKDMSRFKITLPSDEKEQTDIATILSDMD
ncbi:restriction endonuclease subunit S, partial [Vibrio cholerae]|nr:restriction endonuclease subunit S [Vibrio cholerae]